MSVALVAVLAVGFIGGPSADATPVMDMRQSNRVLIVGTWAKAWTEGLDAVWEFRRDGRITVTFRNTDGTGATTATGTYRVDAHRLSIRLPGCPLYTADVVRLNRRTLVLHRRGRPARSRWWGPTR
jgi:uncharacterized protein (TIGR03066 family)